MSLCIEDGEMFTKLLEKNGYTALLDAMIEHARSEVAAWERSSGPRDAIAAIMGDLRRTIHALETAAIDVRG